MSRNDLTRFWFRTERGFGVGVTASSEAEAWTLAQPVLVERACGEILEVVPDIDVSTLDPGHVIPNMHPPNLHGVWFPMQGPL